jgi:hypothetical protein
VGPAEAAKFAAGGWHDPKGSRRRGRRHAKRLGAITLSHDRYAMTI